MCRDYRCYTTVSAVNAANCTHRWLYYMETTSQKTWPKNSWWEHASGPGAGLRANWQENEGQQQEHAGHAVDQCSSTYVWTGSNREEKGVPAWKCTTLSFWSLPPETNQAGQIQHRLRDMGGAEPPIRAGRGPDVQHRNQCKAQCHQHWDRVTSHSTLTRTNIILWWSHQKCTNGISDTHKMRAILQNNWPWNVNIMKHKEG
jgi:hypothetical protein